MEIINAEKSDLKKSHQHYYENNLQKILAKSELTGRLPYNSLLEKLYKGISKSKEVDYLCELHENQCHGAIFNLEFTPNGKTLVAACEGRSLLFFDPSTQKKTNKVFQAHDDCVNCMEFLDSRTFVTGSDDETIRQWDLRNLKSQVNTLTGHRGWVKSLSYSKPAGLLFSSAFDTTLRVWNINGFNSDGHIKGHILLDTDGVIRSKLSKDGSKLFLTLDEAEGIMVLRDLDIFNGEDPSEVCRTLDLWLGRIPHCLQTISGFPDHSNKWCVYTIDVHPYDWCIVTRYSDEDNYDMLVVHDVQDRDLHGGWKEDNVAEHMTHYIKEAPSATGLIKEVCFSADGRIISSPDKNGVRLLAFNDNCHELSDCVPSKPTELSVVNSIYTHKRSVLATKFSPILPLLVTGCKAGDVCFHMPKF